MTRSGIVVAIILLAAIFGMPYLGGERRDPGFILPITPPPENAPSATPPTASLSPSFPSRTASRPPSARAARTTAARVPLKVKFPAQLSLAAKAGQALFAENCEPCHGENATGTENGPPLVHKLYAPHRQADFSFYRAVKFGVKSRNWNLGDMPPIEGIRDHEIEMIISFVRALQKANGIY